MEYFTTDILHIFLPKNVKIWLAGCSPFGLSISRDCIEVSKFPKVVNLALFSSSRDNSHIRFLLIIIWFRFSCDEKKLCENVKK